MAISVDLDETRIYTVCIGIGLGLPCRKGNMLGKNLRRRHFALSASYPCGCLKTQ